MYTSLNEAVQDLQFESATTQKVLDALTDASLAQPIVEGHRTLGELAWHLATAYHSFLAAAGLQLDAPKHNDPVPATAKGVADGYRTASEAAAAAIQAQWTDASLPERRLLWGMMDWSVSDTINIFIRHQAHHRGQLTVLMRQAGLVVPGVYGPSKEEMEAMSASH
ncbi:hypothetical protein SD70_25400 [Gordoniibacillus kamchatkensis]|uniref:Damage-inducible protein DinB n=1 Tax=Gordoniibacillus kamchatkensis TaxID=1590651 RepID=A0ABR5AC62_9BACL|nr:DinB family protein [Paenibacillus sp. VKM B-2647]KIL38626.1 hypothetical protein SD70_25400 [Paenibacillus sp. VKM B-2647]